MIPDAEVLKVLIDTLKNLEIGNFEVKVNHRKFLDAIIEISGCESSKFKPICSSVDKLDKEPWEAVRKELITQKGLTEEQCDKLGRFVNLKNKPRVLLNKLKAEGYFEGHAGGLRTIEEMDVLFGYLENLGVIDNVAFDFSLARGLDYYTGLIYEAVLTDGANVGSIAGGGRYDELVGMFSGKNIPAVGVSIGIERIFAILEEKFKGGNALRETNTQFLVASLGGDLTNERMSIASELWKNGFNCEIMYKKAPKSNQQFEYALSQGIPYVIIIGQDEIAQGKVKVKNLKT